MGYLILAMNSIYFTTIYTPATSWHTHNFSICSQGIRKTGAVRGCGVHEMLQGRPYWICSLVHWLYAPSCVVSVVH